MRLLVIDTALDACQAAVLDGDRLLAARSEPMTRGHQERLAPLVEEVMAEARSTFAALDRIGVTIGPGSFTGLRVGLAFAKGVSLALRVPCVGVGCLEALAACEPLGVTAAVVDARQDGVYLQLFTDSTPQGPPERLGLAIASERLATARAWCPVRVIGPAASLLGGEAGAAAIPDLAALGRRAAQAPEPSEPSERPRPLYLRAPDARTIAERAALALRL